MTREKAASSRYALLAMTTPGPGLRTAFFEGFDQSGHFAATAGLEG